MCTVPACVSTLVSCFRAGASDLGTEDTHSVLRVKTVPKSGFTIADAQVRMVINEHISLKYCLARTSYM